MFCSRKHARHVTRIRQNQNISNEQLEDKLKIRQLASILITGLRFFVAGFINLTAS